MADAVLVLALAGLALAAAGWLAHRLRLPSALGYLLVGLAVVPVLDRSGVDATWIREAGVSAGHVAVLFLLFAIGMELDLKKLRQALGESALTLPFDILVPALAITAMARVAGWELVDAAILGLCVCLSSTLFGERLTAGADPQVRRRVLGVLLAEDVAAAALLTVIVVLATGGRGIDLGIAGAPTWLAPLLSVGRLVLLLVLLAAGALLVVPRLLDAVARTHAHDLLVLWTVVAVVAFGALGAWAGSAELGAFVGGVAAAEAGSRFSIRNSLQSTRDIALGVFFFVSGFGLQVADVPSVAPLAIATAAIVLFGKLAVHVPAAIGAGMDLRNALQTGLALGTLGEFSLILVAAAAAHGGAHPLLQGTVVGALLVLLVVTPVLRNLLPTLLRWAWRLPPAIRRPAGAAIRGLRRRGPERTDPHRRRSLLRKLAANLLLLVAWGLFAASMGTLALDALPQGSGFWGPTLVFGTAVAVATPLLYRTYRAYRDLVWLVAGLRPGETPADMGALRLRARLVDAWVVLTAVLLLIPVSLLAPDAMPVLLGGLFLAVLIATLAWRQLSTFQRTLEGSVARVLGEDAEHGALLDQILDKYPWGVRFSAVAIPPGSPVAGRTLEDARIPKLTGASVAVLQRRHREVVNPEGKEVLLAGDTLVLMGDVHQIARAEALIVAYGDAIRLTAQSRMAEVVEVEVHAASGLVGLTLGQARVKERTGTLVAGVWPAGTEHPVAYADAHLLHAGDRLIVLGSPLQVARVRELAQPESPTEA